MTSQRRQALLQAGILVDEALERFMGNEALLEKFLHKFLEDDNYQRLVQAINHEDYDDALRAAHTLKGVCGNLSMHELYRLTGQQVELFRQQKPEEAKALLPAVEQALENIKAAVGGGDAAI